MSTPTARQIAARPMVRLWLYAMAALVFCMVIVGGATRLTDSGLSITEWKPLLGAIPPLTEAAWLEAFAKYKAIPEYQLVNKGMSLAEFEFIYWWEWGHRFLGRIIGLAFLLPFLFFLMTGRIERAQVPRLVMLFILGGLQGALGWYMVMSGLTERVDVSQYRLAAHLTLATLIFAAIFWTALGIGRERPRVFAAIPRRAMVLLVLLFIQIALGGFVAGLDAGMGYNTWPLMDGQFIPAGLMIMEPAWRNLFENAMTVQFTHRMTAYFVVFAVMAHWWISPLRRRGDTAARLALQGLVLAVLAQAAFGVWTLLAMVPIHLGLIHQGGALVVLAFALAHLHHASLSPQMGVRVGLSPVADLR
ncbi:MAG: COX15/CtaA family protein [Aestuariivirgaceae bacterium]|nr:COX15/CtaA family protein [Aestuariivirgaceae bacterium]